jgi:hypothetical protein
MVQGARTPWDDRTGTAFAPGETTKTITIVVNGANKEDADETFYLDLFGNSPGAPGFTKSRGIGTILNDDRPRTI